MGWTRKVIGPEKGRRGAETATEAEGSSYLRAVVDTVHVRAHRLPPPLRIPCTHEWCLYSAPSGSGSGPTTAGHRGSGGASPLHP